MSWRFLAAVFRRPDGESRHKRTGRAPPVWEGLAGRVIDRSG